MVIRVRRLRRFRFAENKSFHDAKFYEIFRLSAVETLADYPAGAAERASFHRFSWRTPKNMRSTSMTRAVRTLRALLYRLVSLIVSVMAVVAHAYGLG